MSDETSSPTKAPSAGIKVVVDCVIEDGRLVQVFDTGDKNREWCIHGTKLRWSCDDCENYDAHLLEPAEFDWRRIISGVVEALNQILLGQSEDPAKLIYGCIESLNQLKGPRE